MVYASLKGGRYEIGLQHGRGLRNVIHCAIRQNCRFLDLKQKPDARAIEERQARLTLEYPHFVEEMMGIAEGAECSPDDIVAMNLGPWRPSCSNIAFCESDEGPILGHANDHKPGGHFDAIFAVRFLSGERLLYVGSAGHLGSFAGVNGAGLAVTHASARPPGAENARAPLNMGLYTRVLLEACRDAGQAELFLKERTFRSGGDNIMVLDAKGAGFVAEKYPLLADFRFPEKGAMYGTNRTLAPKTREMMGQDDYERSASEIPMLINRERYLQRVIHEHQGRFTRELMERVLRCTDADADICNPFTNWAAVLLTRYSEMLVSDRFPCHNEFRRYVVDKNAGSVS